jgi:hypothetical protein
MHQEQQFTEDCPTVAPTPTLMAGRSSEEMNRELLESNTPVSDTPTGEENDNRLFKGAELDPARFDAEKQRSSRRLPLSSTISSDLVNGKGKAPEKTTSSSSTANSDNTVVIYPGEGTQESPFIVDWSEDDPSNPMRWVCYAFNHQLCTILRLILFVILHRASSARLGLLSLRVYQHYASLIAHQPLLVVFRLCWSISKVCWEAFRR